MRSMFIVVLTIAFAVSITAASSPAFSESTQFSDNYIYREIDGQTLNAYVFMPISQDTHKVKPAILLFHGGGWVAGSAEWTFEAAQRFADLGMVAISIEYRLSDDNVTPIDALTDVRAAFRWVRKHKEELNIDSDRVAGYGVSAGGHLVAAAATIGSPGDDTNCINAKPDALLLWSPALDVASDGWFCKLLQGRGNPSDLSPAEHADSSTPPTSIVHGAEDNLTPLSGIQKFSRRMIQSGVICDLNIYSGLGHLLTRNLENQESDFDPDPEARAAGIAQHTEFLREIGFISSE